MSAPEVIAWIKAAQQHDSAAVSRLYETFADRIYRYIAYRVPTTADAEDITAEVFVSMIEHLPNFEITGAPFEAWLYRIAAGKVADFHRKLARRPQSELLEIVRDDKPLPEEDLETEQEFQRLREAVGQLNEEHQNVLILRFIQKKSHKEVAAAIGKNVSAVRSIQHRALIELTRLLGSDEKIRHYLRGDHD
jgi:RNA polymerase sigma-70 factor, ECF subfamily